MINRRPNLILATVAVLLLAATSARAQFPRTVLVEEFTSITCVPCTTATAVLNQLLVEHGDRFVTIRNQVNLPAPHTYWTQAGMDRLSHYGIVGIPAARLDGAEAAPNNVNDIQPKLESRLDEQSPISLDVTQTRQGDTMNVHVTLVGGPNGLGPNQVIHVVAIQRETHDESILQVAHNNGETTLYDEMRIMVNGVDGDPITVGPDEMRSFDYSYVLDPSWDANMMYTVVFVQDGFSDVVAQTGFSARPVASVDRAALPSGFGIEAITPLPARTAARLPFSIGRRCMVELLTYAIDGTLVGTCEAGVLDAGSHTLDVSVDGLPAGVYSVVLRAGTVAMSTKLVVNRN